MADELQEQQVQQPAVSPEVAQMMEMSLNGGQPPVAPAEIKPDAPAADAPPVFSFDQFKEKYNYEKPEDIFKEIEDARLLKANPPQAEPFKFENEASEKLAKAFLSGKTDEVYQYLDEQRKLDKYLSADVTEDLADEIIKMGLKVSHKDLSDAEINFKFNKQYGLPKEPVLDVYDEDSVERHNAWKEQVADIKMSKIIDAKLARPQLETAKSKLVLPEITATVDQDYIQWQKLMEEQSKLDAQISEEYKTITPKDVEFKMPFNDEANKIAFEFQYEPDVDGLKKSADLATNIDALLQSYKSNGKFDKQAFLKDIHFGKNKEAILLTAMNQAKNATIKASLPNNNDGGGLNRQNPALEQATELQKQMQNSLAPFQRN